ncbi:hypothetical protein PML80_05945 [Aerococcus urinaeequi]|uniref:Uncharacterized protein n=1 Tax=Aerococcus urinaeequi TaxID=51665 RepID=A0AAF0BJD6_9LACT|nr:hypothetical protein [Aerococcus urinaeequi]WCG37066.1 hypothetical protein PML80_05945 [Aerococcus urinaeequi]
MNIQERIEALETEFNEKIKALKAEVQREDEFPQFGDDYWYVDSDTDVMDTASYDGEYDRGRLSIGNVFKTKEQAEFAVEKLKVEAELRKHSRPFEYGKFNYYLFFDIDGNSIITDFTSYCPPQGAIYFESEEKAQQAIKSVGIDRIKKYLFGVE